MKIEFCCEEFEQLSTIEKDSTNDFSYYRIVVFTGFKCPHCGAKIEITVREKNG